jgi:hypothetical protein
MPQGISLEDVRGCLREILREAYRHPEDELADIVSDALVSWCIPLVVDEIGDEEDPFDVKQRN